MFRVLAVAINTFREAVRDRVLNGVLGVALAVLVATLALAEISLDQQRRIVLDIGIASISFFSVVVAVFLGSSLLYKEIERKTLYVILPKPIRRHEFLLGKYFGIALTAFVFVGIMGAVQLCVTAWQAGGNRVAILGAIAALPILLGLAMWKARDRTAVLVPWSAVALAVGALLAANAGVVLAPILAAFLLTMGEVLVLTAVALVFSAFSTPFLTALFTIGVWVVGRSADLMIDMKSNVLPAVVKDVLKKLVHVWPNFNVFVPGRHTLEAKVDAFGGPLAYVAQSMGYAVLYSAVLLTFASLIFRRRDFL
ncbi:MAG TPA: ABC transporter permease subunit [Polyangiales bacterium]|jgi:ABC-type transport system involved in multi-copper enzyme maturation permease subunit|nr:ABC transporter permease subunit [Polyangiales bacterium]